MQLNELPALVSAEEDGFADLRWVAKVVDEDEDSLLIEAGATHLGQLVCIGIHYPKTWTHDPQEGAPSGFGEYNTSLGIMGLAPFEEATLKSLSSVYGVTYPGGGVASITEVAAVTLEGDPGEVLTKPVRLKIFFGAFEDSHGPYAEAFLNIDLSGGTVELREKDAEYREAIVQALALGSAEGPTQ